MDRLVQHPDEFGEWYAGLPLHSERAISPKELETLRSLLLLDGTLAGAGLLFLSISLVHLAATGSLVIPWLPTYVSTLLLILGLPALYFVPPTLRILRVMREGAVRVFDSDRGPVGHEDFVARKLRSLMKSDTIVFDEVVLSRHSDLILVNGRPPDKWLLRNLGPPQRVARTPHLASGYRLLSDAERMELRFRIRAQRKLAIVALAWLPVILAGIPLPFLLGRFEVILLIHGFTAITTFFLFGLPAIRLIPFYSKLTQDLDLGEVVVYEGDQYLKESKADWQIGGRPAPWRVAGDGSAASIVPNKTVALRHERSSPMLGQGKE